MAKPLSLDSVNMAPIEKEVSFIISNRSYTASIRSLTFTELQETIAFVQNTGWYGNIEASLKIVSYGLVPQPTAEQSEKIESFAVALLAREIWILTLRAIAKTIERLCRAHGLRRTLRVGAYKFTDLATPQMLYFLADDVSHRDVERYVSRVLGKIADVRRPDNSSLKAKERIRFFRDYGEVGYQALVRAIGGDREQFEKIPTDIFRTPAERFYVFLQLVHTLDWPQYLDLWTKCNTVLEMFAVHSNQMGGIEVSLTGAKIRTGAPYMLTALAEPLGFPATMVLSALDGMMKGDLTGVSRSDCRFLRAALRAAGAGVPRPDPAEISAVGTAALQVCARFGEIVQRKPAVVRSVTLSLWPQYVSERRRVLRQAVKKHAAEIVRGAIPACLLLLEGESDVVYFLRFLSFLDERMLVRPIDCKSKAGVRQRYENIIHDAELSCGVVTVVDKDGLREHEAMSRMQGGPKAAHFLCPTGAVETIFEAELHAETIATMYPDGLAISAEEIRLNGGDEKAIAKLLWQHRQVTLRKVEYAKVLADKIDTEAKIPEWGRLVCMQALKIGAEIEEARPLRSTGAPGDDANARLRRVSAAIIAEN